MTNSTMDDDAAAVWAIRLEGPPLTAREEADLEGWLAEDEARRGRLLRAEATLAYLDRGRALAAASQASSAAEGSWSRRWTRYALGAFSITVLAILAGQFLFLRPVEIETAVGEVREVRLTDGSIASVNTNSRVAVAIKSGRRDVSLTDGEVWFKVAHDKTRPFVVTAGDVRVQAVGTAFSVRLREQGADVLVTEGVVETWIAGRENERRRIEAGSKGYVTAVEPAIEVVSAASDIDRALAWRNGELALNGETLQYAASEINRYNSRKLVIDDPQIAREPLVGYFRVDQPESFGRAVAQIVGARVTVEGDVIRISKLTS